MAVVEPSSQFITAGLDKKQVDSLKRAIQDSGKEARASVRRQLKAVGTHVADEIKSRTPVHGKQSYGSAKRARLSIGKSGGTSFKQRHIPGLLRKSTRLRISSYLSVAVYNNAKAKSRSYPGGYRYGKRLEFDPKFSGRYAFFYPGWEASRDYAGWMFLKVLDDVEKTYKRG